MPAEHPLGGATLGLRSSSVVMSDGRKSLQQSSKCGPRSGAPVQPRDLPNERNERPCVDGRGASIGQFGRRSNGRGLIPAPRSNEPCECGGEVQHSSEHSDPPCPNIFRERTRAASQRSGRKLVKWGAGVAANKANALINV